MTALPITLPKGFTTSVSQGDSVTIGQLLARRVQVVEYSIDLPQLLGISGKKSLLVKSPGEVILRGDIIAQKKSMFLGKSIVAQRDCKVLRLEEGSGHLVITTVDVNDNKTDAAIQEGEVQIDTRGSRVIQQILSPLDGTVTMCNNEQIVLQTDKNIVAGLNASGGNVQGKLRLIDGESVSPEAIKPDMIGTVILGKSFSRETLQKAIGMEVLGIVGTHINEVDLTYFSKKRIETPIIHIPDTGFPSLALWEGKSVYVDGPTQTVILLSV